MWVEEPTLSITQGTIVDNVDWGRGEDLNPLSIVMSNACDIEHGHSNFLIVAALEQAADVLPETAEFKDKIKGEKISTKQKNALKKLLSDYIHNKNICRHFFFDPRPVLDIGCLLVDFQQIKCVEFAQINTLEPVAQLKHPFVEQMIMRFTSYTARIPVDRVDECSVEEYCGEIAGKWLYD